MTTNNTSEETFVSLTNTLLARERGVLAPWPQIDRYPTVIGSELSLLHISSAQRSALLGYRALFCDILDELVEKSPHSFSKVFDRIAMVSGAPIRVLPALLPPGHEDVAKATELAEWVNYWLSQIDDFRPSLGQLLWGIYYGMSAAENIWVRDTSSNEWRIERLNFIASRRLNLPDPRSWDIFIWDQGATGGGLSTSAPLGGLRIRDYPNKFVLHTPKLRGTYSVRDGIGRALSWWIALASMGARGAGQFIERWGKPWALFSYTTATAHDAGPRMATQEDLDVANQALAALASGAAAGVILPDSVKATLEMVSNGMDHEKFIGLCNDEITKLAVGQTYTTSAGKFGSKGASGAAERSSMRIANHDAIVLAGTIRRDIVAPLVRLNRPEWMHLLPRIEFDVQPQLTQSERLEQACTAGKNGIPVSAVAIGREAGLPLIQLSKEDEESLVVRPVVAAPVIGEPDEDDDADEGPESKGEPADAEETAPESAEGPED